MVGRGKDAIPEQTMQHHSAFTRPNHEGHYWRNWDHAGFRSGEVLIKTEASRTPSAAAAWHGASAHSASRMCSTQGWPWADMEFSVGTIGMRLGEMLI